MASFAPAVVYLLVRGVGVDVLAIFTLIHDTSLREELSSWDGQWYLSIAEHGYLAHPGLKDGSGESGETILAFFPGYPALMQGLSTITGIPLFAAGMAVNVVAGVIAAYGLVALAERVGLSRRGALVFLALVAAAPMSIVFSMSYPTAVLTALTVWALVAVLDQRWVAAGVAASVAGLMQVNAVAIIVTVMCAGAVEVWRHRTWRAGLAIAVAPLGMVAYLSWIAVQTGKPLGYFAIQRAGWDTGWDWGISTVAYVAETLAESNDAYSVLSVGVIVASLWLLVLCFRARQPAPLLVFTTAAVVLALGTGGVMANKPRELLPAVTLALPLATAVSARRNGGAMTTTALVAVGGLWFSAYALTVWTSVI